MKRRDGSRLGSGDVMRRGKDGRFHHRASPGLRYETPLDDDSPWTVTVTLEVSAGRLVVADLRLAPRTPGAVPDSGVTTKVLRQVRVAELVEEARTWARETTRIPGWSDAERRPGDVGRMLDSFAREVEPVAEAAPAKSGRGRPDRHYLGWAVEYVHKLEEGSHAPVSEIAQERGVPRGLVRDRLHVARRRGLLTDVPEGARIGGQLTQYAKELLAEQAGTDRRAQ